MENKSVTMTVMLPYAADSVWRALTEKELMSQWLMLTDFEPIPSRTFKFYGKANRFWRGFVDCHVLEVRKPELLRISWQSVESQRPTEVRYDLREHGSTSELRVTHSGFDSTHGAFSGLLLRTMIRHGLRTELRKRLPLVLAKF
jgi:uncharacterized protein YndB with AHSA1/START domain